MKKPIKTAVFILILLFSILPAQAIGVGSGISVYIPESLYKAGQGSVSLEQSIEFDLGVGDYISFPLGVQYNTNYGLMVRGTDLATKPWFYSDALMPYAMVKAHIPIGPFYLEAYGGGGLNWNITLRSLDGNIESDLSTDTAQAVLTDGTINYDNKLGYGFMVGGAMGITLDKISIEISAHYRYYRHNLNFSADFDPSMSQVTPGTTYDPGSGLFLVMSGISVGIGGSFSF